MFAHPHPHHHSPTTTTPPTRHDLLRFPPSPPYDKCDHVTTPPYRPDEAFKLPKTRPTRARTWSIPRPSPLSRSFYYIDIDDTMVDGTSISSISAVAATARGLYRRAKISGPEFAEVAPVVRSLHTVIKHLRAEAEDPDSLLNSSQQESSIYARQLTPIVEDTDFTLKQLDTILEKYGSYPSDHSSEDGDGTRRNRANSGVKRMEDRERDMVQLIRTKLANQKTNIDIFLDTVQLHNPTRQHQPVDLGRADDKQMNNIKDKVDIVAARIFQRRARARASGDAHDESQEDMWQQFWIELVNEGFSGEVLRKHKEVLRAYIRELESNGTVDDNPPSVRGLLDHANGTAAYAVHQYPPYSPISPAYGSHQPQQYGSPSLPPPVAINPTSYPANFSRGDSLSSPKEVVSPTMNNEKFAPSIKLERRRPEQSPFASHGDGRPPVGSSAGYNQYPPRTSMPVHLSYERNSSDVSSDTDSSGSQQLALISTRDLMDMDRKEAEALANRVGGLHLGPALLPLPPPSYSVSPGTSPHGKYLPPPSTFQGQPNLPPEQQYSSSPLGGASPRYVPPLPGYGASPSSTIMTPPPPYKPAPNLSASPVNVPSFAPVGAAGIPPPPTGAAARQARLAPDSKGAEIPLEAKWTRIKRTLVSPEVLDQAGLRYEARPDFVAVLGVLNREEIASFAKKSAEVRASRARGSSDASRTTRPTTPYPDEKRDMQDNHRRRARHSESDVDSDSASSSSDESDTSDSGPEVRTRNRGRSNSSTDKYIPREIRQKRKQRRHSNDSTIQEEPAFEGSDDNNSRTRAYPFIVPPMNEKGSPAATVLPKPILKNRNENHVRFDDDGPREVSPGELERERDRRERRERRRGDRDADRERRRRDRGDRDRDRDRDRERERDRGDRDRDRERDRGDRERHRERERDRDHHSSHYRQHRERDRDEVRDKRRVKKSVWGETLGAVGIGGAAASLLSVLTEAAAGF